MKPVAGASNNNPSSAPSPRSQCRCKSCSQPLPASSSSSSRPNAKTGGGTAPHQTKSQRQKASPSSRPATDASSKTSSDAEKWHKQHTSKLKAALSRAETLTEQLNTSRSTCKDLEAFLAEEAHPATYSEPDHRHRNDVDKLFKPLLEKSRRWKRECEELVNTAAQQRDSRPGHMYYKRTAGAREKYCKKVSDLCDWYTRFVAEGLEVTVLDGLEGYETHDGTGIWAKPVMSAWPLYAELLKQFAEEVSKNSPRVPDF